MRHDERNAAIAEDYKVGLTVTVLARRYNLSRTHIHRILEGQGIASQKPRLREDRLRRVDGVSPWPEMPKVYVVEGPTTRLRAKLNERRIRERLGA